MSAATELGVTGSQQKVRSPTLHYQEHLDFDGNIRDQSVERQLDYINFICTKYNARLL